MRFDVVNADSIMIDLMKDRGSSTGVIELSFEAELEDVLSDVNDEDLIAHVVDRCMISEILDKIGRDECLDHFGVEDD